MSLTCNLTSLQKARLRMLEVEQPDTKVLGTYRGYPVILHRGTKRENTYQHMAYLNEYGRLCGMGPRARRIFRDTKRMNRR